MSLKGHWKAKGSSIGPEDLEPEILHFVLFFSALKAIRCSRDTGNPTWAPFEEKREMSLLGDTKLDLSYRNPFRRNRSLYGVFFCDPMLVWCGGDKAGPWPSLIKLPKILQLLGYRT